MAIIVRKIEAEDHAAVAALWASVFGYSEARNDPARVLDDKLDWDGSVLVALDGAQLIGTVLIGYDGHRGWLYRVAVSPVARRRGVGARLVHAAEAELRALGCKKINLQLHTHNGDGEAFWRALGYDVEARISMGKDLSVSRGESPR